ncbi:serpin family protein [Candidatus Dojkabacteria bacterium]|nr:serpin family protein [Candidatus Dojkabacteria bacterium]
MKKFSQKFLSLVMILAAAVLLSSCGQKIPKSDEIATEFTSVTNSNNQFAVDLFSELSADDDGNLFFSPYSIGSAIAMTYEGAEGQTAQEIMTAFTFPGDKNALRDGYQSFYNAINNYGEDFSLSTANAIWVQEGYPIAKEYIDTVDAYYGGKATNLDFINNSENSRDTINSWVADQTQNKISNLMPEGTISSWTRMVLTNAIYFEANWYDQFDSNDTEEQDFYLSSGEKVQVATMAREGSSAEFGYAEDKTAQILELPYEGEDVSMIIYLPKKKTTKDLQQKMTVDQIEQWESDLVSQKVDMFIPKFEFKLSYDLVDVLNDMGMEKAFESDADFTGMFEEGSNEDLYIGNVVHKAFVKVDEAGTEAAAATGIDMVTTRVEPAKPKVPVFRADHPFIFIIKDNNSDVILFMGRVADPSA